MNLSDWIDRHADFTPDKVAIQCRDSGLTYAEMAHDVARLAHALTKIRGGQSLSMARLRVKSDEERRALAAVWAPAGALVKDEFTQQPGALEHAIAVRATYGRERYNNLHCADYARPRNVNRGSG